MCAFFPLTNLCVAGGVSEEADLLFVKKFSFVTSRTLPPSSWALLRDASATSSRPRYLWNGIKCCCEGMVNLWTLHNQSTGEQLQADEFINSLWTAIEAGMIGRLRLLKHTSNLSHLFLDCGNPGTLPHQCNTHHHPHNKQNSTNGLSAVPDALWFFFFLGTKLCLNAQILPSFHCWFPILNVCLYSVCLLLLLNPITIAAAAI